MGSGDKKIIEIIPVSLQLKQKREREGRRSNPTATSFDGQLHMFIFCLFFVGLLEITSVGDSKK